jgi:hypothetical protein
VISKCNKKIFHVLYTYDMSRLFGYGPMGDLLSLNNLRCLNWLNFSVNEVEDVSSL